MNATKERQAWCCLLCDPCLSALYVPWCEKALYKHSSFSFPLLCFDRRSCALSWPLAASRPSAVDNIVPSVEVYDLSGRRRRRRSLLVAAVSTAHLLIPASQHDDVSGSRKTAIRRKAAIPLTDQWTGRRSRAFTVERSSVVPW